MSEMMFKVVVTATGEVRDKDGNLISETPVEARMELTATQLTELGLPVPPEGEES